MSHATGGAECRQSCRSCSDEYTEYYLPNAILLHFLPPFCFLRCNNRVLLSPGVHRHEGTHTLDVGSLAHLLDLDWKLSFYFRRVCHRVSFRPLTSFTASSAVWLCVPLRVSFSPHPVGSNLSTKLILKRPESKPARQAYLIWRQVMMLLHDDPNLSSLKHSKRSYLTIDEYDYILNRLKTLS